MELEHIDHDGENFGYDEMCVRISPYQGYTPFTELQVIPLRYHP
jgi:hypothetical protein